MLEAIFNGRNEGMMMKLARVQSLTKDVYIDLDKNHDQTCVNISYLKCVCFYIAFLLEED